METRAQKRSSVIYAQNRTHPNYDTPTKARIYYEVEAFKRYGPTPTTPTKSTIYARAGIPYSTAHRILNQSSLRRVGSTKDRPETRGRRSKLTPGDLERVEHLIHNYGNIGRRLGWGELAHEADLDCTAQTLQQHMGSLDYRRCIACRSTWVSPGHATRRLEWATHMKTQYPHKMHWHSVRSSDEVHFGYGPEGKIYVTRMPGERYCIDCTQFTKEPTEKDAKRGHAWAAVGYNFKSDLIWYDVGNRNGKMNATYYRNVILDQYVKPWIDRGDDFTLEEDQDSSHGVPRAGKGIVQQWKRDHGLKHYFNCSASPDLAPIENCWQPLKQDLRKIPHWDLETIKDVTEATWYDGLLQRTINKWMDSMPERLQDVIDRRGGMTSW